MTISYDSTGSLAFMWAGMLTGACLGISAMY